MSTQEFDYVIVGGGSAGCVLAGRLSEDPSVKVCLLETGPKDDSAFIHAPLGFAIGAPLKLNIYDYETTPQPGLGGRKGYQPRGRTLGGSSSVNAMVYTRGNRYDYDQWAALGNPGWDYASVLPYFKRSENCEAFGRADAYRGMGGPLNVANLRSPHGINRPFLEACASQGIAPTPDYNGAEQEGYFMYQVTQINGERCSAAKAYLTPHLGRPNLTVRTGALATRVLFDGKQATGVEYRCDGGLHIAKAGREVLLSGGAYGSAQLLMLSGVGRGADLKAHGIPLVHEMPGVGQSFQDHITATFVWRTDRIADTLGTSLRGAWRLFKGWGEWKRQRTGPVTTNVAESGAFVRTGPDVPAPNIQLALVVGIVDDHNRKMHLGHGYSIHVTLSRPKSRGQVTLASADPAAPLLIDPGFLSDPDDMATLKTAVRQTFKVMNAAPLAPWRGKELFPVNIDDDADLERAIRAHSDTEYHPIGTCRMGPDSDPMAVVDSELRVKGLSHLRVVDASIMPNVTTGNTNAPTIMIAEKAVDMLLARAAPV